MNIIINNSLLFEHLVLDSTLNEKSSIIAKLTMLIIRTISADDERDDNAESNSIFNGLK